ncbi:hypothetical protein [Niabella ginsengisoli]|uniref:Uncharacterized protein n=1 Tax=Niabella ginsengisoli TaxID=522298 RepID=A0ABS9SJJ1_9BACT|nr:hypothetical protein [Niabella ginsengisoli]MCH5598520.1 hypothetical protein [Niabella ginsengisoli]
MYEISFIITYCDYDKLPKKQTTEIPDIEGEMTIVRDCTGTYLRHNNLDYQVCNKKLLKKFNIDEMVIVSIKKLKTCYEEIGEICLLEHENEGWVKVLSVKK